MRELLITLRGSVLVRGEEGGQIILHYHLPNGQVIEVVKAKA